MEHPNLLVWFSKRFVTLTLAVSATLFLSFGTERAAGKSPQVIVEGPQSVDAIIGEPLTLSLTAKGSGPVRYCWRKDGRVIPGATKSKLKLKTVLPSAAGAYTVEAMDRHGEKVVIATAHVRVCAPSLQIYRDDGIKLTFKASKGICYTVECKNVLSQEAAWKPFASIWNRNGIIQLTDPDESSNLLCVFRLKAETKDDCDRGRGHHHHGQGHGYGHDHHDHDDDE